MGLVLSVKPISTHLGPLIGLVFPSIYVCQEMSSRGDWEQTLGPVRLSDMPTSEKITLDLGSEMYAVACMGFRQKSSRLLIYFRTAVSSAWSNSEVDRAVQISFLTSASRV